MRLDKQIISLNSLATWRASDSLCLGEIIEWESFVKGVRLSWNVSLCLFPPYPHPRTMSLFFLPGMWTGCLDVQNIILC